LRELFGNEVLLIPACCWAIAQICKVLYHLLTGKGLDLRLLVSAGGMPSSHSALVCSLATAVAIREGLNSSVFAICVVLAAVVMYDAAGVRRAASIQARLLNRMLDELFRGRPISEKHVRELIGHTPFEVIMGAALGVVLTWLWMEFGF